MSFLLSQFTTPVMLAHILIGIHCDIRDMASMNLIGVNVYMPNSIMLHTIAEYKKGTLCTVYNSVSR